MRGLAGQPAGVSHGPYQAPARILDDERREIEREYSLVAFARLLAIEIGEPGEERFDLALSDARLFAGALRLLLLERAVRIGEPPSLLEELSLAPCGFRAPVTGLPAARAR